MTTQQVVPISKLRHKDLLGISDLTPDEILLILDTAEAMREIDSTARQVGFRVDGWEGYTKPVQEFISAYFTELP